MVFNASDYRWMVVKNGSPGLPYPLSMYEYATMQLDQIKKRDQEAGGPNAGTYYFTAKLRDGRIFRVPSDTLVGRLPGTVILKRWLRDPSLEDGRLHDPITEDLCGDIEEAWEASESSQLERLTSRSSPS